MRTQDPPIPLPRSLVLGLIVLCLTYLGITWAWDASDLSRLVLVSLMIAGASAAMATGEV
jgi:hypothetical protein